MIATKKALVFQFNIRATTWWIASQILSLVMYTWIVCLNIGKLFAIVPQNEGAKMHAKGKRVVNSFMALCILGIYFATIFAFGSDDVDTIKSHYGGYKSMMERIEGETGIWLAEYSKEQLMAMRATYITLLVLGFLVFMSLACYMKLRGEANSIHP